MCPIYTHVVVCDCFKLDSLQLRTIIFAYGHMRILRIQTQNIECQNDKLEKSYVYITTRRVLLQSCAFGACGSVV